MKKLLFAWVLIPMATAAQAGVNPSTLWIKVLGMRLSPNADCSNSILTFSDPDAQAQDFVVNPSLGTGVIPQGTYNCIMVRLGDVMRMAPAADDGTSCVAGVPFTQDIFNTPSQGDVSIAPDGSTINGSLSEDDPWAYFSTSPNAAASNGCWQPTLNGNSGPCVLSAPIVVHGDSTHTLVVNFDGTIHDAGGNCSLSPPVMSFR